MTKCRLVKTLDAGSKLYRISDNELLAWDESDKVWDVAEHLNCEIVEYKDEF